MGTAEESGNDMLTRDFIPIRDGLNRVIFGAQYGRGNPGPDRPINLWKEMLTRRPPCVSSHHRLYSRFPVNF